MHTFRLHTRDSTALINPVYTAECDQCDLCPQISDPLQDSHYTSHGPNYETIKGEQDYDVINHSGSYPSPARPTGLCNEASTATYSRLAGDRNIYFTLEPSEVTKGKDEEGSVVTGDVGDQCIEEEKKGEQETLATGDYNTTKKIN